MAKNSGVEEELLEEQRRKDALEEAKQKDRKGLANPEIQEAGVLPNLVGRNIVSAKKELEDLGLLSFPFETATDNQFFDNVVIATKPYPEAEISPGQRIILIVGKYEKEEAGSNDQEESEESEQQPYGYGAGEGSQSGQSELSAPALAGIPQGVNLDEAIMVAEEAQAQETQAQGADENGTNGLTNQATNLAKDYAKDAVKTVAKDAAYEAAATAGSAIAASAPVWGPILAGAIVIFGLVAFVIIALIAGCNQTGISGLAARGASKVSGALNSIGFASFPPDVCAQLAISNGGQSGGAGGGTSFTSTLVAIPQQYVKLSAFGTAKFDYPKLKPAFETMVEQIMSQAQAQGLNVHVTSALRQPGGQEGFSCHYLGEAVDIDFDNAIPIGANQTPANGALIDKLLTIVRAAGPGFVQDEYRHPSAGATAGHVHLGLTSDPNCVGRNGEVAQYANEYTMPY